MSDPIPFIDLQAQRARIGDAIDEAIARVLEHGRFILGPEVTAFEEQLAAEDRELGRVGTQRAAAQILDQLGATARPIRHPELAATHTIRRREEHLAPDGRQVADERRRRPGRNRCPS